MNVDETLSRRTPPSTRATVNIAAVLRLGPPCALVVALLHGPNQIYPLTLLGAQTFFEMLLQLQLAGAEIFQSGHG